MWAGRARGGGSGARACALVLLCSLAASSAWNVELHARHASLVRPAARRGPRIQLDSTGSVLSEDSHAVEDVEAQEGLPHEPDAIDAAAGTAAVTGARVARRDEAVELSWERLSMQFSVLPRMLLSRPKRGSKAAAMLPETDGLGVPGLLMVKRTSRIWAFLSRMIVRMTLGAKLSEKDQTNLAKECTQGLIALGPTFIKLGQLLSTRVDVMPPAYIDELATLQDNCPPFPLSEVKAIIDEDLGPGKFVQFDEKPLAAASLGQVHLATTAEGERVAVKVQRPGLRELFSVDLKNLQVLSEVAMSLDRTPDRVLRDWREIFAQNARIIYEEIDYEREARNAQQFAENFADVPWLRVPRVYTNYSSARVLTMEYVPGVKINAVAEIDKLGLDRKKLASYAAESYLIQLLRFGFFHCDPHPGNVACEAVPSEGGGQPEPRIILYDYGMMGQLSAELKAGLVKGFFAVYEKDHVALADALYEAELLGRDTDRLSVEIIAKYFCETFAKRFALERKSLPADKGTRARMRIAAMQSIGQELAAIGGERPFRYPEAFPFILRAFTALEGIGKSLDDEYDVYRVARRYIPQLVDLKDGNAALTAVKAVQKKLGLTGEDLAGLVLFPRKITGLQKFTKRLESGELKLRVRALEVERALFRALLLNKASAYGIGACVLMNAGLALHVMVGRVFGLPQLVAGGTIYCLVRAAICLVKLQRVLRDESNRYYNSYIG